MSKRPVGAGSSLATASKGALGCLLVAWIAFMGISAIVFFSAIAFGSVGWWFASLLALGFGGMAGIIIFPAGLLASGSALKDRRLRLEAEAKSRVEESDETIDQ